MSYSRIGGSATATDPLADGSITSAKIADGTIVNTDVNASAAIDPSKISGTAVTNSLVNAKGDLITATADDTPARLAVGTNGQALLADSTQATGLRWGSVATSGEDDQIVLGVQVFG